MKASNRVIDNWYFTPQVEIKKNSETSVSIKFKPEWMGYAMAKSVWMMEKDYAQSMGCTSDMFCDKCEKEAIICLYTLLKEKFDNSSPDSTKTIDEQSKMALKTMISAVDKLIISEFVMYEILLPTFPYGANQFSEDFIYRIKDYILNVRHPKLADSGK
jgi:hypothetical protein